MALTLTLPYPPSVNHYWRHVTRGALAGCVLISAHGRAYRKHCMATLLAQKVGRVADAKRLAVTAYLYPPDRRRRDIDNSAKALLDALVHAGVIRDDSDIDELSLLRREPVRGGRVDMTIQEIA